MTATAHQLDGRPITRRREEPPAPLGLWIQVAVIVAILLAVLVAVPKMAATPMPGDADARFYREQLGKLDRQMASLRGQGKDPLSIVFLGTSRMKNAAYHAEIVASSAKKSGVTRPVASTFIGINWGGFERLTPAMKMIAERQPDVVVMMPELL